MATSPDSNFSDANWKHRAQRVIPGGCSTGSKRPIALYGSREADAALPTHFVRAEGCTVWASDGRSFLDLGMALGAVGLGYANPSVTLAVQQAAAEGNVSSLPHLMEVQVAERLVELIPCAERVRFLRTGAEAVAAAVRIARTVTNRERVIACGYFGWLDWSNNVTGVPEAVSKAVTWVPFNDVDALNNAVSSGDTPAAIVIEPLVHEIASVEWLGAARRIADSVGAVLVFDEVKTAFRVRTGGVQQFHGIVPDLTALGKALANGYPLAAVVGKADVMNAAERTWISSTAATENTGLAAAHAVLSRHTSEDVCGQMWRNGEAVQNVVAASHTSAGWLELNAIGPAVMWRLECAHEPVLDAFVAAASHHGVLFKRGAYQFASLAHDGRVVEQLERAMPDILESTSALLREVNN